MKPGEPSAHVSRLKDEASFFPTVYSKLLSNFFLGMQHDTTRRRRRRRYILNLWTLETVSKNSEFQVAQITQVSCWWVAARFSSEVENQPSSGFSVSERWILGNQRIPWWNVGHQYLHFSDWICFADFRGYVYKKSSLEYLLYYDKNNMYSISR